MLSLIPVSNVPGLTPWVRWEGLSHGVDKPSLTGLSWGLAWPGWDQPSDATGSGEPAAAMGRWCFFWEDPSQAEAGKKKSSFLSCIGSHPGKGENAMNTLKC